MEIRQANIGETTAVASLAKKALYLDLPWFNWTREETISEAVREGKVTIVVSEGVIVGLLWLEEDDDDRLSIEALAVTESQRGQGLGRRLVEVAKKTAVDLGAMVLCVGSFIEYEVRPFYETCGFTCLGQELWDGLYPFWYFELIITQKTDP